MDRGDTIMTTQKLLIGIKGSDTKIEQILLQYFHGPLELRRNTLVPK
jgi:hypothetical protein